MYTPVCLQDEPTCMRIEPVCGSLTSAWDDLPDPKDGSLYHVIPANNQFVVMVFDRICSLNETAVGWNCD